VSAPGTPLVRGRAGNPLTAERLPFGQTALMAFGQQTGPPASAREVKELLSLLQDLGHSDFRDARGPIGLTQRQAGGKFTRDEAADLIERLGQAKADGNAPVPDRPAAMVAAVQQTLRRLPAEDLAAELRRRGWTVEAPAT
jgi:hypothetical protein